jgi:hypothetical protein
VVSGEKAADAKLLCIVTNSIQHMPAISISGRALLPESPAASSASASAT